MLVTDYPTTILFERITTNLESVGELGQIQMTLLEQDNNLADQRVCSFFLSAADTKSTSSGTGLGLGVEFETDLTASIPLTKRELHDARNGSVQRHSLRRIHAAH